MQGIIRIAPAGTNTCRNPWWTLLCQTPCTGCVRTLLRAKPELSSGTPGRTVPTPAHGR